MPCRVWDLSSPTRDQTDSLCIRNTSLIHWTTSVGGGLVTKSCLTLATPWTVDYQAPLSMGLLRQEYWSGLPFPFPWDLPNPGIEPGSPALQAYPLLTEPLVKSLKKPGFLLLKQWSMGQQGQHHLRIGWNVESQAPPQTIWVIIHILRSTWLAWTFQLEKHWLNLGSEDRRVCWLSCSHGPWRGWVITFPRPPDPPFPLWSPAQIPAADSVTEGEPWGFWSSFVSHHK